MASEVTICNQALSWLGESRINSLNDSSNAARLCLANYDELRRAVLEEANWSFASTRFKLEVVLPPDDNRWGKYKWFMKPPGQLLMRRVYRDQEERLQIKDWKTEGEYILAEASTLYVRCISDFSTVPKMTATFRMALAARLALELSLPITQSTKMFEMMERKYESYLDKAALADGTQGARENVIADRLTNVRGG